MATVLLNTYNMLGSKIDTSLKHTALVRARNDYLSDAEKEIGTQRSNLLKIVQLKSSDGRIRTQLCRTVKLIFQPLWDTSVLLIKSSLGLGRRNPDNAKFRV